MQTSDRGNLVAAYSFTAAKLLSWLLAIGLLWRFGFREEVAALFVVRATLGLLNYTSFGLAPIVLRQTADSGKRLADEDTKDLSAIERAANSLRVGGSPASVFTHTFLLVIPLLLIATAGLTYYAEHFDDLHGFGQRIWADRYQANQLAWYFGLGILFRVAGDVFGSITQGLGWFKLDQCFAAAGEVAWVLLLLTELELFGGKQQYFLNDVSGWFATAGLIGLALRFSAAAALSGWYRWLPMSVSMRFLAKMLGLGGVVVIAQAADFFYAPIDYIVIQELISTQAVATYGTALQVDAALIVLAGAVSVVALATLTRLAATGRTAEIWSTYVRLSVLVTMATAILGLVAWLISPIAFRLWLGEPVPTATMILPLVLVHTILGAAAGVGRSAMLAIDRAGAYALSVLLGGGINVLLSVVLVLAGLDLWGVILGTIVSVALRCLLWMPWYIRRTLAEQEIAQVKPASS